MELLQQNATVVVAEDKSQDALSSIVKNFDALITRMTTINKEIIKHADRLEVIGLHRTGLDIVDVQAATEQGICVVHTPGANAQAVAEFVVTLMAAMSRQLIPADYAQRREGRFDKRDHFIGHDLYKKIIGIVGFGQIGRRVANICRRGFNMNVVSYDPFVTDYDMNFLGVKKAATLEELLRISDFVSLNCPVTPDVEKLINRETLALMKPSSYLINCARGPIVDESALIWALETGHISGAALDVFQDEPPDPENRLFSLPGVLATPHMAGFTHDSMDTMSTTLALDVLRVLSGERPLYPANPSIWDDKRNKK